MTKLITTNIFDTLFLQDATKQNKKIKSNYLEIWNQVEIYMHCKAESENPTQCKELLANTTWRFLFLDDDGKLKTGKNNKLIYGNGHKKNMASQVVKLAGLKDEFFSWSTNGEKSDVTSLSGTISAITPKTENTKSTDEISGDGETDASELDQTTDKGDTRSNDEVFQNFMNIWYKEKLEDGRPKRGNFFDYLATLSDEKMASFVSNVIQEQAKKELKQVS